MNRSYPAAPSSFIDFGDVQSSFANQNAVYILLIIHNTLGPCFTGDRIVRLFTQHIVRGDFWLPAYVNYGWGPLTSKN